MFSRLRSIMGSGSALGYLLQAAPVVCIAGVIYGIARIAVIRKSSVKVSRPKEAARLLLVCYLTGLVSLVILPANFWLHLFDGIFLGWWEELSPIFRLGEVQPVPLIIRVLSGELILGSWVKTMLIGNVAMFLPLGFLLPFATEKVSGKNIVWIAAAVPLAAELLQTGFGRSFDADDLICNFLGIVVGFLIALLIRSAAQKRKASN